MIGRLRTFAGACGLLTLVALFGGLARAERGGQPRLVIFPFQGPAGVLVRNNVADRLSTSFSSVQKVGAGLAKAPVRTAARYKADAIVAGRIRCPGARCVVEVIIYRKNGRVWSKASRAGSKAKVSDTAASLAMELLGQVGLSGGGGGRTRRGHDGQVRDEEEVFGPSSEENLYAAEPEPSPPAKTSSAEPAADTEPDDDDDEEPRRRRRRDRDEDDAGDDDEIDDDDEEPYEGRGRRHEFDAIELYLTGDLGVRRDVCVDLTQIDGDDRGCNRENPGADDRAYNSGPYPTLGARLNLFPGAFSKRRRWYSHIGVYFEYDHSLGLSSKRVFEVAQDPPPGEERERIEAEINTREQSLRAGLVYRIPIPFRSTSAPQLRVMIGFGLFEFAFEDTDYPADSLISPRYRDSNPYLASFRYLSVDGGLELRIPIVGVVFPYLSLLYRGGLTAGQADRIYGPDSTIHGLDGELGLRIEVGAGVRLLAAAEVLWYGSSFSGRFAPESDEERDLWEDDAFPGDSASDLIIRVRLGLGWAY